MITVAQKTLLFTFLLNFSVFFNISSSFSENNFSLNKNFDKKEHNIYKKEDLKYKVYIKGIKVANAQILYTPNKSKNSYNFYAFIKNNGALDFLYSINEQFFVKGIIANNKKLIPLTNNIIINENSHNSNRTNIFFYDKKLIKMINKEYKDRVHYFPLIGDSKDMLSYLYYLRFTVNLNKLKPNQKFYYISQFLNKTVNQTLIIGNPYYKEINNKRVSVRKVKIFSKTTYFNTLTPEQVTEIRQKKRLPNIKALKTNNKKSDSKFYQNLEITITNDEFKVPLIIKYESKYGTFKAILQ